VIQGLKRVLIEHVQGAMGRRLGRRARDRHVIDNGHAASFARQLHGQISRCFTGDGAVNFQAISDQNCAQVFMKSSRVAQPGKLSQANSSIPGQLLRADDRNGAVLVRSCSDHPHWGLDGACDQSACEHPGADRSQLAQEIGCFSSDTPQDQRERGPEAVGCATHRAAQSPREGTKLVLIY